MKALILVSAGLALAGPWGLVLGLAAHLLLTRRASREKEQAVRPILLLLLVELRSGQSALGAIQAVATSLPDHRALQVASRVATISGLTHAALAADRRLRPILAQLARAQRSGAPLAETVRAAIEADIAEEKASRIARARTVPVRLMIPITLLLLPGLVLLFYAPSLLRLFEQMAGPLS